MWSQHIVVIERKSTTCYVTETGFVYPTNHIHLVLSRAGVASLPKRKHGYNRHVLALYRTHAHAVTSLMAPRQAAIRGVHPCSLSSFSSPFCTPSSVSPFLHPFTISQSDLCEHEPKKSTVSELWVRADCYFHRYLEKQTRWRNDCKHTADRYYQALSARCLWQSLCLCDY